MKLMVLKKDSNAAQCRFVQALTVGADEGIGPYENRTNSPTVLCLAMSGENSKTPLSNAKGTPENFGCEKGATVSVAPGNITYGYPAWRSEHGNG